MGSKGMLAMVLSLLLIYVPVAPAGSPTVVGKITSKGQAQVNDTTVPAEATVFAGDRITTQQATAVGLSLRGGDQVFLPSLSAAKVNRAGEQVTLGLEHGSLAVVQRSAQPVVIEAQGVRIQSAGPFPAVYEVAIHGKALKVMARKGTTTVTAANRTVEINEGKTMEATVAPAPVLGALSTLAAVVLVASIATGVTGLILGVAAIRQTEPQECVVVSPSTISCP